VVLAICLIFPRLEVRREIILRLKQQGRNENDSDRNLQRWDVFRRRSSGNDYHDNKHGQRTSGRRWT